MISAVFAAALALGVAGPCFGNLASSKPSPALQTPIESKAEIREFRAAKNSVVLNKAYDVIVFLKISYDHQVLFIPNFYCPLVALDSVIWGQFRNIANGQGKASDAISGRKANIFTSQHNLHIIAKMIYPCQFRARQKSGALMVMGNLIRFSSGAKRDINQANTYHAKNDRHSRRPKHRSGPISGIFLRVQIPNFALVPLFFIGIGLGVLGFKGAAYAADTRRDIGILGGAFIALCGGGIASGVVTYWLSIPS